MTGARSVAWALALAAGTAAAGPMMVLAPDGTRWHVNDDDDPALLERRLPGGKLDPSFGHDGRVTLDFGTPQVSVEALRVETPDTGGRIWVGADSTGPGANGSLVLRLLADGQPDPGFGAAGRSIASPGGQRLTVVDLLPDADGTAWVAGNLVGPMGQNDVGLWHVKSDGSLDYAFGPGGLWRRPGPEHSRAIGLAQDPDGGIALGLQVVGERQSGREVWVVKPGSALAERTGRPVSPAGLRGTGNGDDVDDGEAYLAWTGFVWMWRPGPQTASLTGRPAAPAPQPPAGMAPGSSDAGHIALNPFSEEAPAASAPPAPPPPADGLPWGWILGGLAGALALAATWWRGRR